jgi:lipopolysaccharide export system permease protein
MTRETLLYGSLAFVAGTSILISQNLLQRLDDLLVVGFTRADLLVVLRCFVFMVMPYAIPIAILFGALLAIRRMSSDAEILAMRSCGVGLRTLVTPTVILGALVSGLSAYLMLITEHEARRDLLNLFKTVINRGSFVQSGKFGFAGHTTVFTEEHYRNGDLRSVMISDRSSRKHPFTLFAERGHLSFDNEAETINIHLQNGEIHLTQEQGEEDLYHRILFEAIDYTLDLRPLLGAKNLPERPKQMELDELRSVVADHRAGKNLRWLAQTTPIAYELEIHRRFALPLAPLLFSLAAVPLGLLFGRRSRTGGLPLGLGFGFGYYGISIFFQFLARQQLLMPVVSLWAPNLLFAALAFYLLARAQNGFDS